MDLGIKYDDMPCGVVGDSKGEEKKHYPTVPLETDKELTLPEEGTVTFKFKKKSAEWRKRDDGKERYACTLELKELVKARKVPAKGGKKMDFENTDDALEKLAAAIVEKV